jgi:hypothetical protein
MSLIDSKSALIERRDADYSLLCISVLIVASVEDPALVFKIGTIATNRLFVRHPRGSVLASSRSNVSIRVSRHLVNLSRGRACPRKPLNPTVLEHPRKAPLRAFNFSQRYRQLQVSVATRAVEPLSPLPSSLYLCLSFPLFCSISLSLSLSLSLALSVFPSLSRRISHREGKLAIKRECCIIERNHLECLRENFFFFFFC